MADRFASRLARETQRWVRDGIISAAQAELLLARYPVSTGWLGHPIVLFALIGGAMIAAAIALVVAHNWYEIHRWAKLGGLLLILALAYAGGLALRERERPAMAEGVLLLGGALVMVAIALIGQIYQLSGRPADAVLLWWVVLVPAAYVLPSAGLGMLSVGAFVTWYFLSVSDRTTLLGAALQGPLFALAIGTATFGMTLFAAGILHGRGRYRPIGRLFELAGLLLLFGGLLPLGFDWRSGYGSHTLPPSSTPVLAALLTAALVAVAMSWLTLPGDTWAARVGFIATWLIVVLYLAGSVAVLTLVPLHPMLAEVVRSLAFANWLVLFGAPLVLILVGARWGSATWINVGVLALGVHAISRFIDLFGTMLQTSALFFIAGAFLLGLGWALERMRRRVIARVARREAT